MPRILIFFTCLLLSNTILSQNVFSVKGNRTYLNNSEFLAVGFRCSNALLSDATTNELIMRLDEYKSHGLNTISVYFMGSRYSNIYGYNLDGTLNPVYRDRMGRIIEACDARGMVVLVGILYWGSGMSDRSNPHYASWGQKEVNNAMRNTLKWLSENNYKNVFIDPDNEGMAEVGAKFDIAEMICEGQKVAPSISIAYNARNTPPPCADLAIHFAPRVEQMPYIETEGTPREYWGEYSKERGLNHYINVGIYTEGKKAQQLQETKEMLENGNGYLFASTWLQNIPPNYHLGGDGSPCDPGIKWWVDFVREWMRN
jgi:hypothetical protein